MWKGRKSVYLKAFSSVGVEKDSVLVYTLSCIFMQLLIL
jgi:hypothetical protein